jgi:hypothetical protein
MKHILRMTIVAVATGDVVSTSVWMDLDFHCSIHTIKESPFLFSIEFLGAGPETGKVLF